MKKKQSYKNNRRVTKNKSIKKGGNPLSPRYPRVTEHLPFEVLPSDSNLSITPELQANIDSWERQWKQTMGGWEQTYGWGPYSLFATPTNTLPYYRSLISRVVEIKYKFKPLNGDKAAERDITYGLFVPETFNPNIGLMVALHGIGGNHMSCMQIEYLRVAHERGCALVSPMGYDYGLWYGAVPEAGAVDPVLGDYSEQDVMMVTKRVVDHLEINLERIYIWGLSMGGLGALHLACKYPYEREDRFWKEYDTPWDDIGFSGVGIYCPAPSLATIAHEEAARKLLNIPVWLGVGDIDVWPITSNLSQLRNALEKVGHKSYKFVSLFATTHGYPYYEEVKEIAIFLWKHTVSDPLPEPTGKYVTATHLDGSLTAGAQTQNHKIIKQKQQRKKTRKNMTPNNGGYKKY